MLEISMYCATLYTHCVLFMVVMMSYLSEVYVSGESNFRKTRIFMWNIQAESRVSVNNTPWSYIHSEVIFKHSSYRRGL